MNFTADSWGFRIFIGILGIVVIWHLGAEAQALLHHFTLAMTHSTPWLSNPSAAIHQAVRQEPWFPPDFSGLARWHEPGKRAPGCFMTHSRPNPAWRTLHNPACCPAQKNWIRTTTLARSTH